MSGKGRSYVPLRVVSPPWAMDGHLSLTDCHLAEFSHPWVALSTQNRLNVFPIVTGAEKCPRTKPGLRCRVQRLAGVGVGMVGLSLVMAITATVVVPPGPVTADQVSNLKAQAAQIAQDLVLEQLQIGTYQQQYDVDVAKVQRDEAEIGSSRGPDPSRHQSGETRSQAASV